MTETRTSIPSATAFDAFDPGDSSVGLSLAVAGDALEERLPELHAALSEPTVQAQWQKFHQLEPRADGARKDFLRDVDQAHRGTLGASALAAGVLVLAVLAPDEGSRYSDVFTWLFVLVGICAILFAALGRSALERLRRDAKRPRWLEARAEAEGSRRAYFRKAIEAAGSDPGAVLAAFDYAVHFLLDDQIRWLGAKVEKLGSRADAVVDQISRGVLWAAALTGIGGLLGAVKPVLAIVAAFGGIATAWATYWIHRDEVENNRVNEDRYFRLRLDLRTLRLEVPLVRARIASGQTDAALALYDRAAKLLESEGSDWRKLGEELSDRVDAIEEKLGTVLDGSAMKP